MTPRTAEQSAQLQLDQQRLSEALIMRSSNNAVVRIMGVKHLSAEFAKELAATNIQHLEMPDLESADSENINELLKPPSRIKSIHFPNFKLSHDDKFITFLSWPFFQHPDVRLVSLGECTSSVNDLLGRLRSAEASNPVLQEARQSGAMEKHVYIFRHVILANVQSTKLEIVKTGPLLLDAAKILAAYTGDHVEFHGGIDLGPHVLEEILKASHLQTFTAKNLNVPNETAAMRLAEVFSRWVNARPGRTLMIPQAIGEHLTQAVDLADIEPEDEPTIADFIAQQNAVGEKFLDIDGDHVLDDEYATAISHFQGDAIRFNGRLEITPQNLNTLLGAPNLKGFTAEYLVIPSDDTVREALIQALKIFQKRGGRCLVPTEIQKFIVADTIERELPQTVNAITSINRAAADGVQTVTQEDLDSFRKQMGYAEDEISFSDDASYFCLVEAKEDGEDQVYIYPTPFMMGPEASDRWGVLADFFVYRDTNHAVDSMAVRFNDDHDIVLPATVPLSVFQECDSDLEKIVQTHLDAIKPGVLKPAAPVEEGEVAASGSKTETWTDKDGDVCTGVRDPATGNLVSGTVIYLDGTVEEGRRDPRTEHLVDGTATRPDGTIDHGTWTSEGKPWNMVSKDEHGRVIAQYAEGVEVVLDVEDADDATDRAHALIAEFNTKGVRLFADFNNFWDRLPSEVEGDLEKLKAAFDQLPADVIHALSQIRLYLKRSATRTSQGFTVLADGEFLINVEFTENTTIHEIVSDLQSGLDTYNARKRLKDLDSDLREKFGLLPATTGNPASESDYFTHEQYFGSFEEIFNNLTPEELDLVRKVHIVFDVASQQDKAYEKNFSNNYSCSAGLTHGDICVTMTIIHSTEQTLSDLRDALAAIRDSEEGKALLKGSGVRKSWRERMPKIPEWLKRRTPAPADDETADDTTTDDETPDAPVKPGWKDRFNAWNEARKARAAEKAAAEPAKPVKIPTWKAGLEKMTTSVGETVASVRNKVNKKTAGIALAGLAAAGVGYGIYQSTKDSQEKPVAVAPAVTVKAAEAKEQDRARLPFDSKVTLSSLQEGIDQGYIIELSDGYKIPHASYDWVNPAKVDPSKPETLTLKRIN